MKKKILVILVMMLFITIVTLPNIVGFEKKYENPEITSSYATLSTSKFIYHKGETVYYTILNQGSTWITLGGPPMGEIQKLNFLGFNWQRVYPESWFLMIRYVEPGNSITEEWDQTDLNGNQVSIGIYRVDAWYTESSPPPSSDVFNNHKTASDYFIIIP